MANTRPDTLVSIRDNSQPLTTSIIIAEHTGVSHHSILQNLSKYSKEFNELGLLAFEMRPRSEGQHGGGDVRYALLNEQQATFLISLSRNTPKVVEFKLALTKAFFEARQKIRELEAGKETKPSALPAPEPTTSELVAKAQAKLAELDKLPPLPLPLPVPVRLSTSGKSHPPYVPSLAPRYQGLTYPKLFMMLCGELKADAEQMAAFDYCLNKARQQGYAQGKKGEETETATPCVSDADVAELKRRLAEAEKHVSALETRIAQGGYLTQLRASEFLKCFKHVRDQYSDLKPMIEALRQIGANMVVWRINGCFDAMKSVELSLKPDCERVLKLKAPKEDFARVWHIKHRSSKD